MLFRIVVLLGLSGLCLPVFAAKTLLVSDAYVRGMPPGQKNTAAFLHLSNLSDRDIALVSGRTDVAEKLEIHQHIHNAGMMRMVKKDRLQIPAGESQVFQPGGYHLMLIGLTRFLKEGDTVTMTLFTESGEALEFSAPVISVLNKHH